MFARMISELRFLRSVGESVLTVALVPTGMKTGVWMRPCGVFSVPVRAEPSLWEILKENII